MSKKSTKKSAESFDYATFEKEAIAGLTAGKGLIGEDGVLTGMIGRLLRAAFEGEISAHLSTQGNAGNRRNGHTGKTLRTALGLLLPRVCDSWPISV